jgi:ribosomal-protein-alanine N-acetyltransferase
MMISLNGFSVRQATKNDLPLICVIEDGSFPDPYPPDLMAKLQREHSDGFLVVENASGEIVGYCVASENRGRAHLISIAVHPEYLRKGAGTMLLETLLARLYEHRVDELRLEVNVENDAAVKFYERLGFNRVTVIKNYYSDGSSALKMRLPMKEPKH